MKKKIFSPDVDISKKELRDLYKIKREEFFKNHDLVKLNIALARNLAKVLPKKSKKYWATYKAHDSEANPTTVESKVSISWCYPVVDGNILSFYENTNQEWVLNQYKIEEPSRSNKRIELNEIEGILLPAIAFDLRGRRLGSGKAYYDQTLKSYSGIKIGVAYSVQVIESLPYSEHDIPVDVIVTEQSVYDVRDAMKLKKIQERKLL